MKQYVLTVFLCLILAGCTAAKSGVQSQSLTPRELDLRLGLAESHINNRQPQQALQELMRIESQAKHLPRYHFDLGMVFVSLNEMERALAGFQRAVEIDPDYGEAWNNLGKVQENLGQDRNAEASYRRAFEILTYLTPEFAAFNLGSLYLRTGRTQEADDYARKALARNWRYLPAYKLLADALVAQNRMEEAEKVLQSGMESDLTTPVIMLALGEHKVRMGKKAEAKILFEQIIAQHPKSDEAKLAKDYLVLL